MRSRVSHHPVGFTRTHVLSVVASVLLVVLGVGMLLPSISRVRAAAERMQCSNHLKQIALALYNYADVHPVTIPESRRVPCLPAGTVSHPSLPPNQRLSWFVELLPYLEYDYLYRTIDRQVGWESNGGQTRVLLKTLRCPSWEKDLPSAFISLTSYRGAAGIGLDAPELLAKDPRAGVFGYDRRTAFVQILDGTANTVMVLESAHPNGAWAMGGFATVRGLDPNDQPYTGLGRQFGGIHFGDPLLFGRGPYVGCNLAFADGSVRTIRADVPPAILQALLTVAGGEDVPKEW